MPVMTIKPGDHDPVKKPGHYTYGRYECIDIIEDVLADASGPEGFLIGNVIKYLWRFQHKNGTEDLEKARWYLDRAITRRRTMAEKPAPYIARIQTSDRYVTMPYKFFSPLAPEPENGRPVFNRAVAEGAARYIGKEGEFFDKPGGTRERGVLLMITGPACDFRFNARMADGGRRIYAFFSPLNPELPETGADENPQEKPDA